MYSRNPYNDDVKAPTPPENYSGVALSDDGIAPAAEEVEPAHAPCTAPPEGENCSDRPSAPNANPLLGFIGKDSAVFRLFNGGGIRSAISGFGVEEILIIATAAFLFFTKGGDRECAIMLLLLLFI